MTWRREALLLTLEFAPSRAPAPPELSTDRPVLRVVKIETVAPEADRENR